MKMMFTWAETLYQLGFYNVLINALYRLKLKCGLINKLTPVKGYIEGSLFSVFETKTPTKKISEEISKLTLLNADLLCKGYYRFFFYEDTFIDSPPKWFQHGEGSFKGHWSGSPVNSAVNQDIKITWDLSRFHWIQALSSAYSISGEHRYLETLNDWFVDWNHANTVNSGVNWACGQECAIRVIHVLNSIYLLENASLNSNSLICFVLEHAQRIEPTISYAISQDNNHATSEAAALFICGAWLLTQSSLNSKDKRSAIRWSKKGRAILEERVSKLILKDGGFCMYSTNYHRVVLNTLSIVEFWKSKLMLEDFSENYLEKCRLATYWLYYVVDEISGDTLNLGANDGSNPFIIQSADYRDFRPSIQLASVLFLQKKFYDDNPSINEPLEWLSIEHKDAVSSKTAVKSLLLEDSGIVKIISSNSKGIGFVKYPNYQFRPNQADVLHFDLWHEGENILRDGGSYSYNCEATMLGYFSSVKSHNTIEIDNTEPMPRLGVFLLGRWSKMKSLTGLELGMNSTAWQGSYVTQTKATHRRTVKLDPEGWSIRDRVVGAKESIILRWRLKPDNWILNGNNLSCDNVYLNIQSDCEMELSLAEDFESKYYNHKEAIPVLVVSIKGHSAVIQTHISLKEVL